MIDRRSYRLRLFRWLEFTRSVPLGRAHILDATWGSSASSSYASLTTGTIEGFGSHTPPGRPNGPGDDVTMVRRKTRSLSGVRIDDRRPTHTAIPPRLVQETACATEQPP